MSFQTGRIFAFFTLITMIVSIVVAIYLTRKKGSIPTLRKIPGLEAIAEVVGRSVEMNRPVHWTPGFQARFNNDYAPALIASLGVLDYLAKLCARHNARLLCSVPQPEMIPVVEGIIRESYASEGAVFNKPEDIMYYPSSSGYLNGVINTFEREHVGGNIIIGHIVMEAVIIGESGVKVGAFQVGGSTEPTSLPFLMTTCDYTLITEEVYCAGAYLTGNITQLGSIWGQDIIKWISLGLMIFGIIMSSVGLDYARSLFAM